MTEKALRLFCVYRFITTNPKQKRVFILHKNLSVIMCKRAIKITFLNTNIYCIINIERSDYMFIIIRYLSILFSILMATAGVTNPCSSKEVKPQDFRVTAYVVANQPDSIKRLNTSNLKNTTEIILFGCAEFNEKGKIVTADYFEESLTLLKSSLNGQKLYLNLLGPESKSESDNYNIRKQDKAIRHTLAFRSGKLEKNVKFVLEKYGFDGVFFDYEYPATLADNAEYDMFLCSLDKVLGEKYILGIADAWGAIRHSKQALKAVDRFEIMNYDNFDENGNHSTLALAKRDIDDFVKFGYDKSKLDLGLPFYARPTNGEAYWYDYAAYYNKIDENGLYFDENVNLTFSFNTQSLIREKTRLALNEGLGGVMVWHYACDVPESNEMSLFKAVNEEKQAAIGSYISPATSKN